MQISDVATDVVDTNVTSPVDVTTPEQKASTGTPVESQHEAGTGEVADTGMNGAGDVGSLKVMQNYTQLFLMFTYYTCTPCEQGYLQKEESS